MAKIRMLSEEVIGKIAAGEVVERPAAAIKELVENSLDAGATDITVEIQEGGIESFRVTDNGCGIDPADIRMAFERHATSKISREADLDAIGTLGFRGEALASIAAVGRVTLTTRTAGEETGLRVVNEGGQIRSMEETACSVGTSILVRELFFNVPVRKRFLKKPITEANAVTDLMIRMILSRPEVRFRYLANGKTLYQSPGDGKAESAALTIYGSRAVRSLRKVEGCSGGIVVKGFVGIGDNARGNRGGESFFINGRMMRSPLLSGTVEDACRERVMIGKFPICALYLEMPYENVNVNVHPNKLEVRFRDDAAVRQALFGLVYDALQDRDAFQRPVEMFLEEEKEALPPATAVTVSAPAVSLAGGPEKPLQSPDPGPQISTGGSLPPVTSQNKPTPVFKSIEGKPAPTSGEPIFPPVELPRPSTSAMARVAEKEAAYQGGFGNVSPQGNTVLRGGRAPAYQAELPPDLPEDLPGEPEENAASSYQAPRTEQISALPADQPRPMRILGALFHTFILIEYEDHLLMVDQHAVHERLLYEKMMAAYRDQRAGQEMLLPVIVPANQREQALLEENRDLLESIGLVAEPFSGKEVAVRSVPVVLGENETAAFVREAIDALEAGRMPGADKKRASILQMACWHAIKGGEPLSEEMLRSLVEEMIDKKVTPTCPHGRPLVVAISHQELDRKFKRIQ